MHDALCVFGENQLIGYNAGAGNGALAVSGTNVYDLANRHELGEGLFAEFIVTEAFVAGAGTPILWCGITTSDAADGSGNSVTHLLSGGPSVNAGFTGPGGASEAGLTVGAKIIVPLPPRFVFAVSQVSGYGAGGIPMYHPRYLGVSYWQPSWVGNYFSSGRMTARLIDRLSNTLAYPDGVN